jgi:hypothetical protein
MPRKQTLAVKDGTAPNPFAGIAMPDPEKIQRARAKTRAASGVVSGGGLEYPLLKFSLSGDWELGQEGVKVDASYGNWAVLPASISFGFICWKGGKPVDEQMMSWIALADNDPIDEANLADHGPYPGNRDGWVPQATVRLANVKDPSVVADFKTTSLGGRQAIDGLVEALSERMMSNPDFAVPVIELGGSSYFNNNYGKDISVPKLIVVDWGNAEGALASQAALTDASDLV